MKCEDVSAPPTSRPLVELLLSVNEFYGFGCPFPSKRIPLSTSGSSTPLGFFYLFCPWKSFISLDVFCSSVGSLPGVVSRSVDVRPRWGRQPSEPLVHRLETVSIRPLATGSVWGPTWGHRLWGPTWSVSDASNQRQSVEKRQRRGLGQEERVTSRLCGGP